jgi:Na+-driven multidrug efflux pump
LGPDAVAAVSISGNAFFMILGLSFVLGIGGMALIAQAFGRRDYDEAGKIYKQSLLFAILVGIAATLVGLSIARPYIDFFGGTGQSLEWGVEYFQVLIASLLSQLVSIGIYAYMIFIKGQHLKIKGPWQLDLSIIKKSLAIGLPAGLTYFLLALNMLITYRVVSVFGTAALASIGIGFRILQTIYMPVVAVTSAMAAIVAQNYGAGKQSRITTTFWTGWAISCGIMISGTVLCRVFPGILIGIFSNDKSVIHYGVIYLTIMSLGSVIVGTIMTMSAVFQGFGKTYPVFIAAVFDNVLFACLVFTLPGLFGWGIQSVWWIKLTTAGIEMFLIAEWLRRYFRGISSYLDEIPEGMR